MDANRTSLSRRDFLRSTGMGVAALALAGCTNTLGGFARKTKPPNIIFVFADQMRSHVLGCYGNTQIPTPNFDRMAANGVVFENAISTYPVCSPYRAMLMTGLYPMHNYTVYNDVELRDDVPTIAKVCKSSGYATGYIGKWHLEWKRNHFIPRERRLGFEDFWASDNCTHKYFDGFYCSDSPKRIPMPGYKPEVQTKMAVDFIKSHKDRPFCLFMSWGPPHDPYKAPKQYTEQFPPDKIKFRPNVYEHQMIDHLLRTDSTKLNPRQQKQRQGGRDVINNDKKLKKNWMQGYYALTKSLDDCIGQLLDGLRQTGLQEDTILVFASDHGDMMGSHRMASKQMPFEESISVPFILQYPRKVPRGIRTDALLSPVDIMPTLLALADIKCPKVDGLDLSPAAMAKDGTQQDALLIMKMIPGGFPHTYNGVTPWRGVRTKRFTYARLNDRGPWVLFDNKNDPWQMKNLINDPAYAKIREELDKRTDELLKKADDPDDTDKIHSWLLERKTKAKKVKS